MADERSRDAAVDALLKGSATWEPPEGFALRVIAAARADTRRETHVPRSLALIGITGRLRAYLTALGARRHSAVWVVRQYWRLLRGQ
jgi:hypothetical protein